MIDDLVLRLKFEEWTRSDEGIKLLEPLGCCNTERCFDGYKTPSTTKAWIAWKAAYQLAKSENYDNWN